MDLEKELFNLQDKKYQSFQKKLCPGCENIIGIRVPTLRKFARENKDKIDIDKIKSDYYEEIMLKGMLIGMQDKLDYEEIASFVLEIDNWAVCDTFCAGLKKVKKDKENFLEFIKPYLKSDKEFEVRFAVVILLDYYIEEKYIDFCLEELSKIDNGDYYVKMAIAWCYSICFIKYYNKTKRFFNANELDKFVRNKSIQKALESFRLSEKQKTELRKLKV